MSIPKSVFSIGLDQVTTKYLKNLQPVNEQEMKWAITLELLKVAEALLFSPRLTLKVYGENVVAPLLIEHFGVKALHKLLDDGAVDFILWDQIITHLVKPIPGVDPLQSGQQTSPAHSNPHDSAEMGFKWWVQKVPRAERRSLTRKIEKATRTLPKGAAQSAVSSVREHASRGDLLSIGISPDREQWSADPNIGKRMSSFAERILETTVLTERETELMHSDWVWDAVTANLRTIQLPDGLHKALSQVLAIEGLPDIPSLILNGTLQYTDIIELRYRPETKELRKWLWARDRERVSEKIVNEYMSYLARKSGKNVSYAKKTARISVISVVGSLLGTAIGGPIGGAVGTGLGIAAGTAFSLLDSLIGDRILRGDNPRSFATDILRPIVATKNVTKS